VTLQFRDVDEGLLAKARAKVASPRLRRHLRALCTFTTVLKNREGSAQGGA
jgi:hypothetical protein